MFLCYVRGTPLPGCSQNIENTCECRQNIHGVRLAAKIFKAGELTGGGSLFFGAMCAGARASRWAAVWGNVAHLLGEDAVTSGARLECGPVAGAGDERAAFGDDLVLHDVEAAGEVALGLQDGAVGVVLGEGAIGGVVEGAVVALGVFVLELEQAGLAGQVVGFGVDFVHGGVGVVDVAGGVESGFSGRDGLEGVGPEGALVGVGELSEARAVGADGAGGLSGE